MKIKTTKQMRLDELIKYVWENDIKNETFESCLGIELRFGENQAVIMSPYVGRYDTFTVSTEEELTEETIFDELIFVYDDYAHRPTSGAMVHKSIQNLLEYKSPIYKIYTLGDRSLALIWSAEHGIPAEGVIDV